MKNFKKYIEDSLLFGIIVSLLRGVVEIIGVVLPVMLLVLLFAYSKLFLAVVCLGALLFASYVLIAQAFLGIIFMKLAIEERYEKLVKQ